MSLHDRHAERRPILPLTPLSSALRTRRKRRLGPSIPLSLRDDSPRYRWTNGEWGESLMADPNHLNNKGTL